MKLFIDSSTNYLYLSLYEHNQEIDSLVRDGKNKHSETIIDYLKAFLLKNNLCVDDLDSVFVGTPVSKALIRGAVQSLRS